MTRLSVSQVVSLAHYGGFRGREQTSTAAAVAMGESGGNTDALGDNYVINGLLCPSHGLWQIRSCPGTPGGMNRGTRAQLVDPYYNARKAKELHSASGFGPWTVYRTGAYRTHLPGAYGAYDQLAASGRLGTVDIAGAPAAGGLGTFAAGVLPAGIPGAGVVSEFLLGPLGTAHFWIRVAEVVGGAVLVVLGVVLVARRTEAGRALVAAVPQTRALAAVA